MQRFGKSFLPIGLFVLAVALILALNANSIFNPTSIRHLFPAVENELIRTLREKLNRLNQTHPEDRLYLQTDKTFYSPGETIWFSAFLRKGSDFSASDKSEVIHLEFLNPAGAVAKKLDLIAINGQSRGDLLIEEELPGGIYTLKAFSNWMKNDSSFFEKKITVQELVLPRLKMKLDFEREGFAPGEEVVAKLILESNENKALSNHSFRFSVSLGGKEFMNNLSSTGNNGEMFIRFHLPAKLKTGDGLLLVSLDYEGQSESISRSIPIVLNQVKLELFPEGGDLIQNLESRVAFRARNHRGKPTDIKGRVVDQNGKEITSFTSFAKGLGHFNLIPEPGRTYFAQITSPACDDRVELPSALSQGFVLKTGEAQNLDLPIQILSTIPTKASLVATVRGKIYWATEVALASGNNQVIMPLDQFPMGVAQITLFDANGIERCERLAFVNRDKQLRLHIQTDKEKYLPREKVKMTISTTDASGLPVASQLGISVVNDQLLAFADDKQQHLLASLCLQYDIKEPIEEPNFFFDTKESKSLRALDYLLLTSGWRRFSWKEIRTETVPQFGFEGEKAEIYGKILDAYTGKPIQAAFVKLVGTKTTTRSDENGTFRIKKADISSFNQLEIRMTDYQVLTANLTHLNDQGVLYLNSNRPVALIKMVEACANVPMALVKQDEVDAGFADFNWDVVEEKQLAKVPNKERQPARAKPAPKRAQADSIIFRKGDALAKNKAKKEFQNEDMKDMGKWFLPQEEPPIPQQPESHFVRARQFPVSKPEPLQPSDVRTDFRSTLFFDGMLETDRSGKKTIEFYTSDEITSFRITAEGIGENGLPGRTEQTLFTQLPLSISAKIPTSCILGDVVAIPVTIKNNSNTGLSGKLSISAPKGFNIKHEPALTQTLDANQAKTIYLNYEVSGTAQTDSIRISFHSASHSDQLCQAIKTEAKGFPMSLAFSGKQLEAEHEFALSNIVSGSLQVNLTAFPSVVSDLMKGVESILNEPSGCFEQTSMSSYPNAMVLDYLKTIDSHDEKILQRANQLLDQGYKRLISFETKQKGYEWFGSSPGHEALTAYGLMQFNDMKNVYASVDNSMVDRTANWLLAKRNGKGGFMRNAQALDQFGAADQDITDAYIVYALSEAGFANQLKLEYQKNVEHAITSKDPYLMGMMTMAAVQSNDRTNADKLAKLLVNSQEKDGSWNAKKHSITRSGGLGLRIETTSLAIMALLAYDQGFNGEINKAVEFLINNRNAYGGYGSSQATILSLKALTQYAKFNKKAGEDGTIELFADGRKIAEQAYTKNTKDPIQFKNLEKEIKQGKTKFKIKYKGVKNALPYSLAITYHSSLPASSDQCVIGIETSLDAKQISMGQTCRMHIELSNLTNQGQPSTMAIIGLPAGLSAQPWQLKELMEKQSFDYYEIKGNKLFLYYRQMKPNESKSFNLDLKTEFPGTFLAPASSAYLYYTPEFKCWKALTPITIIQ
ncbi:MAG: hypothetical protein K1X82_01735 [Bacteroidia bacterium]|nr:hypothetical protein [Bacteroidia bacterium]